MHVYSIDKDIRRKVIVVIFGISIFISGPMSRFSTS